MKDQRQSVEGGPMADIRTASVRELRSEVERLRTKVDRLEEAREFDRELRGGPEDGA